MAKTGRDLQRLIRAIEGARAAGQPIQIESPKHIQDKITGKLREHDVVLTITHEHHDLVVALECRDRLRPIGVDAVEAFHSKCRDTGIHSSVMVSSNGFTRTAITKGAAYNIRCLSLDQVTGFDWCAPTFMTVLRRNITHAHMYVEFPKGTNLENPTLCDENDVVLEKDRTLAIAQEALNAAQNLPSVVGAHNVHFRLKSPLVYLIEEERRIQAASCTLSISFMITSEQVPLSFQAYSNAGTKIPITQAAVATVDMGDGRHVDFVLSTEADGRIAMGYVPNSTRPE
jgi:hypothetical protein